MNSRRRHVAAAAEELLVRCENSAVDPGFGFEGDIDLRFRNTLGSDGLPTSEASGGMSRSLGKRPFLKRPEIHSEEGDGAMQGFSLLSYVTLKERKYCNA